MQQQQKPKQNKTKKKKKNHEFCVVFKQTTVVSIYGPFALRGEGGRVE